VSRTRTGEAAREEVARVSGGAQVEVIVADLASQQDVRRLARELESRWPSIRALILTAAVYRAMRQVTPDGLEEMFATNYLAPLLLSRRSIGELRPTWSWFRLRRRRRPTLTTSRVRSGFDRSMLSAQA
jgi:NAD(P)-dependent dehydrogenase (short-subunit alcohol dehydrogenase family)